MTRRTIATLSAACLLSASAATLSAAPAVAAGPAPTPSGYIGACNMLNDATMGTVPMVKNVNGNGNIGMFHAVDVSGCG